MTIRPAITTIAALAAGVATAAFRYLTFESFSNDHYLHLARAQQMLMGAWPVRDFTESGLPLMAGASALAQAALGPGLHAEVIWIATAFGIAAALSVVAAERASGSIVLALIGTALTVLAYPISYSYPKLLPYAAAFVAAAYYAARPSGARLTLLAGSVVLAFLFRHDHGAILGAGAAAAVAARHPSPRVALPEVARLVAAGILLASPYLLWVERYEGLAAYVSEGIEFSRREGEKATWTPPPLSIDRTKPLVATVLNRPGPIVNVRWVAGIPDPYRQARERAHGLTPIEPAGPATWKYHVDDWSPEQLRAIVTDPAVADTHGIDRRQFHLEVEVPTRVERMLSRVPSPGAGLRPDENAVAVLYYLAWMLPCIAAVLLWRRRREVAPAVLALVLMAVAVQFLLDRTMLRDPLPTRVRDVVAPFAVLVPFIVAGWWRVRAVPARIAGTAASVVLLTLALWSSATAASMWEHVEQTAVDDGWRAAVAHARDLRAQFAPPHERTGRIVSAIGEYLGQCTPPGARIFAMTFAPEIFFVAGRGFAGGHESLVPGFYVSPRRSRLMLQRLAAEDVPFVVMDTETAHEMPASHPAVVEHVRARYREVARFPVSGDRQFIVLADTTRAPAGAFGEHRLPCFADGDGARPVRFGRGIR